jgi:hypothetical protein
LLAPPNGTPEPGREEDILRDIDEEREREKEREKGKERRREGFKEFIHTTYKKFLNLYSIKEYFY